MPTAGEILVTETLALLDGDFPTLADTIARGQYALWLGSGISLERVVGVPAVIGRVIEYLRQRADLADGSCRYKIALDRVLSELSPPEREHLHLDTPVEDWPDADRWVVTSRLAAYYSEVLETPVDGEAEPDFLLWQAVDVPGSFTGDDPDVEHYCIVMLALEGAFRDIASANWDYLIEAAERELAGAVGAKIDVCIRAGDFQQAVGQAKLLKYHGCAVRAVDEPATYRPLLIARKPQINPYRTNAAYKVMRDHLVMLVQQRRTLMIGFSAQDSDVQEVFVDGAQASDWLWNDATQPFIFAEESLKPGQRNVLASAYPADYNANRNAIESAARVRAFAKPLLLAILLSVMELKLAALAELAVPAAWLPGDKAAVAQGLRQLRNGIAAAAEPDRLAFIRDYMRAANQGFDLYHHGKADPDRYIPVSIGPIQQIGGIPAASGMRQASMAMALLGSGASAGAWTLKAGNAGTTIALQKDAVTTRILLAANDEVARDMLRNRHVDPEDGDTVIILSASTSARLPRSASGTYGRDGKARLREVCMTSLLEEAPDYAELLASFKGSAAL